MNTSQLLESVHHQMGGEYSKKLVKEFVGSMLVSIAQGLANDGIVSIHKFGRLKVGTRKAFTQKTPQGNKVKVKASKSVSFKTFPNLKEFLR